MAPRRFTDGVTNVLANDPMGDFPYLDPTKYSVYFEDFFGPHFGAEITSTGTATYDGIIYNAVDANTHIDVVEDADANGCLSIVTTAADNDMAFAYTVADSMRLRTGKKFFLKARMEATVAGTIGQEEIFVGLVDSASPAASPTAMLPTNGLGPIATDDVLGFVSYDGSAIIQGVVGEADVHDHVPMHTMVTAVWFTLGIYFDGTDMFFYTNDVASAAITPSAIPVSQMGPAVWFKNSEAQIKTFLLDYIFVAAER